MINSMSNFVIVGVLITFTLMIIGFSTVTGNANKADAQTNDTDIEQRIEQINDDCNNQACTPNCAGNIVQENSNFQQGVPSGENNDEQRIEQINDCNNQACTRNCAGNIVQENSNFQQGVPSGENDD
jgi:hypothetical protein